MKTPFIRVSYDAFFVDNKVEDFENISKFKEHLNGSYPCIVKARPVGRGGDVYELLIEFFLDINSHEYFKKCAEMIEGAIAGKLIDLYLFKPVEEAFNELKRYNPFLQCHKFVIELRDTRIFVYTTLDKDIFAIKNELITSLDKNYKNLIHEDEFPHEIYIPVLYEFIGNRQIYRPPLGMLEILDMASNDNHLKFWGLQYNYKSFVYDVSNQCILEDTEFMSEELRNYFYFPSNNAKESGDNSNH